MPVDPVHLRQRKELRLRRRLGDQRVEHVRDGLLARSHDPNRRAADGERPDQPEMLDVGRHDLVARAKRETVQDDVARLGRRAHERDVLGLDADHGRQPVAHLGAQSEELVEDRRVDSPLLERAALLARHHVGDAAGERPERAGVEIRVALEDRELRSRRRELGFGDQTFTPARNTLTSNSLPASSSVAQSTCWPSVLKLTRP